MAYKISIPPKLEKIYQFSEQGRYSYVLLKDGRRIICKADCYCETGTDEDEDADIPALSVNFKDRSYGEIWIEDDIESVSEYVEG